MEGALIYLILIAVMVIWGKMKKENQPDSGRGHSAGGPSSTSADPAASRGFGTSAGSGTGRTRKPPRPAAAGGSADRRTAGTAPAAGRFPESFKDLAGRGRRPFAGEQDVSCRRFGHRHEGLDPDRYVPYDDLENGFIILNGEKMRLADADQYEDRI